MNLLSMSRDIKICILIRVPLEDLNNAFSAHTGLSRFSNDRDLWRRLSYKHYPSYYNKSHKPNHLTWKQFYRFFRILSKYSHKPIPYPQASLAVLGDLKLLIDYDINKCLVYATIGGHLDMVKHFMDLGAEYLPAAMEAASEYGHVYILLFFDGLRSL